MARSFIFWPGGGWQPIGGPWISRLWWSTGTGRCGRCWAVPRSERSRPGMARRGSRCMGGGGGSRWRAYGGLADRSRRPRTSPARLPADVKAVICQSAGREHPRWGARRIVYKLGLRGGPVRRGRRCTGYWPATALVATQEQEHKRVYRRWQREAPMHLWQLDLVGGVPLADGRECKMVTGIDDHSRFVVIAAVVAVPSGRAVCAAPRAWRGLGGAGAPGVASPAASGLAPEVAPGLPPPSPAHRRATTQPRGTARRRCDPRLRAPPATVQAACRPRRIGPRPRDPAASRGADRICRQSRARRPRASPAREDRPAPGRPAPARPAAR